MLLSMKADHIHSRCMTFGGPRVDAAIAKELLRTVEPMAMEAPGGRCQVRRSGRRSAESPPVDAGQDPNRARLRGARYSRRERIAAARRGALWTARRLACGHARHPTRTR